MAEKKIDVQALAMAENDVNAQALEKGDQNKGVSSEKISTEDHPLEAATEQGHSGDVNFDMESNMINSKPPQVIEAAQEPTPSQAIEGAQEPEPSEAIVAAQETKPSQAAQETKPSRVFDAAQDTKPSEASQEPEPSQIIETAQEPEKQERGLCGFDLNQERTCVGSASTPAVAKVLFDLNVVDGEGLENKTLAPSDLQESPREVNQSMYERLNIDLNQCHDEGDGFPSPPASAPPASSSSSSSEQYRYMEEHFDRNGTEDPNIHNYPLHDAASVRIMGINVTISPERNKGGVPKTLNMPSNRSAPKLFGFSLVGTCSPTAVDKPQLLPLFCTSSGGLKRKEPEGGLEPCMPPWSNGKEPKLFGCILDGKAMRDTCSPSAVDEPRLLPLFCTSSTGGLKRKEPGGLEPYTTAEKVANSSSSTHGESKEPDGGQETYVAGTKTARFLLM